LSFELGSIEAVETIEIEIKDPVAEKTGTGWFVTIAGPNHPVHAAKAIERARKLQLAMVLEGRERVIERSLDDQAQARVEMAISCTVAWRGLMNGQGELACDPSNVRKVLADPKQSWVVDQITEVLNDRARFIRRSANA